MKQKVFRVERMFAGEPRSAAPQNASAREPRAQTFVRTEQHDTSELQRELVALKQAIGRNLRDLEALRGPKGEDARLTRAASELGAAIQGMEKATQKILASTETIDESARALCATLQDSYKRGVAQEIQDHVTNIYEACNFQDLAGQRIGKAMITLKMVEEQIDRMIHNWCGAEMEAPRAPALKTAGQKLVNGPMLDGDNGHVDQMDVDRMFA